MFAIGDLIDRGKYPLYILDLLKEDWFYSIIGNHEQLILNRFEYPKPSGIYMPTGKTSVDAINLHNYNGGKWFSKLIESKQSAIYQQLRALPYAITLVTERGDIGLVHAEVPEYIESWLELVEGVEEGDKQLLDEIIWNRDAIAEFYDYHRHKEWGGEAPIAYRWIRDVELTVHGHTGVVAPMIHGNQVWIDTGHVTGELTIIEVNKLFELIGQKNET